MARVRSVPVTFAALIITTLASVAVIWSCSSFESGSSSPPPDAAGSGDALPSSNNEAGASSSSSSSSSSSGGHEKDAEIDVGPRRIECSGRECQGERAEICCIYSDAGLGGSAINRYGECTVGDSLADCDPPPGQTAVAFSECDDQTDCPKGLICCHTFNGINGTCGSTLTAARCVATDKCPLCGTGSPDGGASRIPCDERKLGNSCPTGYQCAQAPFPSSIVARSYCVK